MRCDRVASAIAQFMTTTTFDHAPDTAARAGSVSTRIQFHWSILGVALLLVLTSANSVAGALSGYATALVVVFVHEVGHWLAARSIGLAVKRLVVHGLGGFVETLALDTAGRWFRAWVVAAGPMVNFAVGSVGLLSAAYCPALRHEAVWHYFVSLNFILGILNLAPVWPMDGGRLLELALSCKQTSVRTFFLRGLSFACISAFAVLAIGWRDWVFFINVLLLLGVNLLDWLTPDDEAATAEATAVLVLEDASDTPPADSSTADARRLPIDISANTTLTVTPATAKG